MHSALLCIDPLGLMVSCQRCVQRHVSLTTHIIAVQHILYRSCKSVTRQMQLVSPLPLWRSTPQRGTACTHSSHSSRGWGRLCCGAAPPLLLCRCCRRLLTGQLCSRCRRMLTGLLGCRCLCFLTGLVVEPGEFGWDQLRLAIQQAHKELQCIHEARAGPAQQLGAAAGHSQLAQRCCTGREEGHASARGLKVQSRCRKAKGG